MISSFIFKTVDNEVVLKIYPSEDGRMKLGVWVNNQKIGSTLMPFIYDFIEDGILQNPPVEGMNHAIDNSYSRRYFQLFTAKMLASKLADPDTREETMERIQRITMR